MLTAEGEGTREWKAETPTFRVRPANVVPLSGGGVLFGKPIEYDLAGGISRVTFDRVYAYLASLPGAVTKEKW